MKYIRKSFSLFWLIAVMLFGTVSASAASAKPETPVLSGTAAGNRVTLNWNKVKKASGYQIFLYYKAYGKYKCVGRIKNRNITSFTLTGSEDKLYTYKIRSYLKQGNKTLYSPSSKALEIKTAPGKPVITRIRVREESGTLIKWKKIKTAEGYQIFRSESEDRGYKKNQYSFRQYNIQLYRYRYCFRKDLLLQNTGICTKSGKTLYILN